MSVTEVIGSELVIDYTNCIDYFKSDKLCVERLKEVKRDACTCLVKFELTQPMEGDVFLYYELPDLQTSEQYFNSKDTQQLAGILNTNLSANCGNFSVNEGKPIAPCGQIADSFFQDTYDVFHINKSDAGSMEIINVTTFGLNGITEEDKKHYRNPAGDLKTALKDFAKPKSWTKNLWELDSANPENNGFQNEIFIGWMKADLKRKPALRIKRMDMYKDGIPAGSYSFRIRYKASSYVHQRLVILSSKRTVINETRNVWSYTMIVIGALTCIISTIFVLVFCKIILKTK